MAEPTPDDLVAAYVDLVEAEWLRLGLPARVRRRLCSDLQRDLAGALADGAPASHVLGPDPRVLARDVAAAEGEGPLVAAPGAVTLPGLVARGVGAAVVMAAFVWSVALPFLSDVFYAEATLGQLAVSLVVTYGICAVLVLGGAALVMARYLRPRPGWRSTTAWATGAMAALGMLAVPVCMGIGALNDYSSAPLVLLAYVAIPGALCALGISWAWARRPLGAPRASSA